MKARPKRPTQAGAGLWDAEREHPWMLLAYALALLVGFAGSALWPWGFARAAEPGAVLGLHLGTAHVPSQGQQAFNPGVYVRTPQGFTAGLLRNSQGHVSTYAGWTLRAGPLDVTLGAITGYRAAPVLPLVVPSVRLPLNSGGLAARLALLPRQVHGRSVGLHLGLEQDF